jgi:predicted transcriptional regulator
MNQTQNLTKSAKEILKELKKANGPTKAEYLATKLGKGVRSIRYGLKILMKANLVESHPDLHDLRSFYYYPMKKSQKYSTI